MASNRATFIVDVVTKGLKAAREGVSGLGRGARDAAACGRRNAHVDQARALRGHAVARRARAPGRRGRLAPP